MKYIPRVGDRVKLIDNHREVLGTIFYINSDRNEITVKRDDKLTGVGVVIPDYGAGWAVTYISKKGIWEYDLQLLNPRWKDKIKYE